MAAELKTSQEPLSRQKTTVRSKTKRIVGLITIEPSVLLHFIAMFMGNLLTSNLSLYKACNVNLGYNVTFCEELVHKGGDGSSDVGKEIQEYLSRVKIWTTVIENSFPIFYVLFLGVWSDTYGRKIPYLVTLFGFIVRYVMLILATYFTSWNAEVNEVLSALPTALTGGRTAVIMILYSYVTDITTHADRTLRIGLITVIRTIGKSFGGAIGGAMSDAGLGYYWVFGVALGLELVGLIWTWFTMDDVRDENRLRGKTRWEAFVAVFDLAQIKGSAKAFFRKRPNDDRARLFWLVLAVTFLAIPASSNFTMLYQYVRLVLDWNAGDYGYYNTFVTIVSFIGGIFYVGVLSKALNLADTVIGIMSSISEIASDFVFCYATEPWMFYVAPLVGILEGTTTIAVRSMISKIIPTHETGQVNSFIATLEIIVPLPSDSIYEAIYNATLYSFPGAIYVFSGFVTALVLLIFTFFAICGQRDDVDPNLAIAPTTEKRSSVSNYDSIVPVTVS